MVLNHTQGFFFSFSSYSANTLGEWHVDKTKTHIRSTTGKCDQRPETKYIYDKDLTCAQVGGGDGGGHPM